MDLDLDLVAQFSGEGTEKEKVLSARLNMSALEFHMNMSEKEKKNSILDRKSTRLNSSHWPISYAVFCLKKKKKKHKKKKKK